MKKADNVYVILGDFGWSDLGTWDSLYSTGNKTPVSNLIDGIVLLYDTNNSIIKTPKISSGSWIARLFGSEIIQFINDLP